ncbi:MAG: DUF3147 domain-containing protein [Nitrospirota bacterium]
MSELMKSGDPLPGLAQWAMYFVIGGALVSVSTYLGAQGKGFLAAFVSTFPAITGVTFVLIYLNGGTAHTLTYAKHLLWLAPAWIVYVGFIIFMLNRLGFWLTMACALTLYIGLVAAIRLAMR